MTEAPADFGLTALRESFDAAFAAAQAAAVDAHEDLLTIDVAGTAYAVPAGSCGAVALLPRVVPLPGAPAALMGLVGVRGRLVPVFALASLLGRPAGTNRWLLLTAGPEPVGLAFDALSGQRRAPLADRRPAPASQASAAIRHCILLDGHAVPVLDPAGLLAAANPVKDSKE